MRKPTKEQLADQVEHVLLPVVRSLVDSPDRVGADITITEQLILVELTCARGDEGQVIGREGRHADSLRTLFNGVFCRSGRRFHLVCPSTQGIQ